MFRTSVIKPFAVCSSLNQLEVAYSSLFRVFQQGFVEKGRQHATRTLLIFISRPIPITQGADRFLKVNSAFIGIQRTVRTVIEGMSRTERQTSMEWDATVFQFFILHQRSRDSTTLLLMMVAFLHYL